MMTDTEQPVRPVPRPVRVLAILTLLAAIPLLAVGGLVTSMRAGMSDDQWPTEPWFLATNDHVWANEPKPGFLIEHSHRALGFLVGGLSVALAAAAWWGTTTGRARWTGLVALVAFLALYGEFHRAMTAGRTAGAKELTAEAMVTGVATAGAMVGFLFAAWGLTADRGVWVRMLASASLACVMVQGLLGGFRVYLNELVGTNLAAVHGVFGQLTFAVLTAVVVLSAPRRTGDAVPDAESSALVKLGLLLVAVLVVQLVWAVWVRHVGTPLSQRLHLLTAFVATGITVWVALRIRSSPTAKPVLGGKATHVLGVLAVQLLLGVEAYMGKFAASAPNANIPTDARPVSVGQAVTRTAHQLVGASLLASAVALAVRAGRSPVETETEIGHREPLAVVSPTRERGAEPGSSLARASG